MKNRNWKTLKQTLTLLRGTTLQFLSQIANKQKVRIMSKRGRIKKIYFKLND